MAKQLHEIRLTNPCMQEWTGMQATARGRHCDACAKEVIDFTRFSNEELTAYFTTHKIKDGCGRFLPSQLATTRIPVDTTVFQHAMPQWKKFLLALLVVFGQELFNTELVLGQTVPPDSVNHVMECDSNTFIENFDLADTLKGKDTTEQAAGIDSVQVLFCEDPQVVTADTLDLKDINIMVMGGFGIYGVDDIQMPWFEVIHNTDSGLTKEDTRLLKTHLVEKSVMTNKINVKHGNPPKKQQENDVPFEAILPEDESKKRRRR